MTNKKIKIKYLNDEIKRLEYIDGKSDWIDLRSAAKVELKAGEFKLIHLGIAMELPAGYEAHIAPRSSTFKNFGIIQANSVGVVGNNGFGRVFYSSYTKNKPGIRPIVSIPISNITVTENEVNNETIYSVSIDY